MPANVVLFSTFNQSFDSLLPSQRQDTLQLLSQLMNNSLPCSDLFHPYPIVVGEALFYMEIGKNVRGVVMKSELYDYYVILFVADPKTADDWAKQHICKVNPFTGTLQVYSFLPTAESQAVAKSSLFGKYSEQELLSIGVPQELLSLVRSLPDELALYTCSKSLPQEAYNHLQELLSGFSIAEICQDIASRQNIAPSGQDTPNVQTALQAPGSLMEFAIVEGEEDLRRIMEEPLAKWRVYLHPSQRAIVNKQFRGPARVLGGAGTGKTVVAMHRAKFLAGMLEKEAAKHPDTAEEKASILFTTYTKNLAADIRTNLNKICTESLMKHIEVTNLDAWVIDYLRNQAGFDYQPVYSVEALQYIWSEALRLAEEDGVDVGSLTVDFLMEEWSQVVALNDAFTEKAYMRQIRLGRGSSITFQMRQRIWKVFEQYQKELHRQKALDQELSFYECRKYISEHVKEPLYSSIIVDEGQDLSANAYRLIRALAGEEHPNDIFIVGDSHQRIYRNKAVLSKCGIKVTGRSSILRVNYRTTEEIRQYAFNLLQNSKFDDLDGNPLEGKLARDSKCKSLTHGSAPAVNVRKTKAEEAAFVISELKRLINSGIKTQDICLVAKASYLLKHIKEALSKARIQYLELSGTTDDLTRPGVRLATMHRVKGLEFSNIFLVAVNKDVLPFKKALESAPDDLTREAIITQDKCLLYVALTRAQRFACISCYGHPSSLLSIPEKK